MKRKPGEINEPSLVKKVKMGMDIPSSNLIADKSKKQSTRIVHKLPAKMTSVPDLPLKMKQDPTQILYKMAIVRILLCFYSLYK